MNWRKLLKALGLTVGMVVGFTCATVIAVMMVAFWSEVTLGIIAVLGFGAFIYTVYNILR